MGPVGAASKSLGESYVSARLERVFSQCFFARWNTRLAGGAIEPLYQPAESDAALHVIHYREDYFASALHEVAHWCIAGTQRRKQTDFGYWYAPDGRSLEQQKAFQAAEVKPQALEWFFSKACRFRFQVSLDNLTLLDPETTEDEAFHIAMLQQTSIWQKKGLPERASLFYRQLCREFFHEIPAEQLSFSLTELNT